MKIYQSELLASVLYIARSIKIFGLKELETGGGITKVGVWGSDKMVVDNYFIDRTG